MESALFLCLFFAFGAMAGYAVAMFKAAQIVAEKRRSLNVKKG